MAAKRSFRITIFSDNVCPWCFVGKRNLEKALASPELADSKVRFSWKPFFLNENAPDDGGPIRMVLEQKYGRHSWDRMNRALTEAGNRVNITFNEERHAHNTMRSHRLVHWAEQKQEDKAHELIEVLFKAYFEQAKNISDISVLKELAQSIDLPDPSAYLESDQDEDLIRNEFHRGRIAYRITGVPYILVERTDQTESTPVGMGGAQPPDTIKQALLEM